jgi:hypothetical protein
MSTSPAPKHPIPKASGRRWAFLALVVVLGVHSVQAIRLFPSLKSIVDPATPVLVVDHAIHEYHGALGARFVREGGTSWGYDPYFMAGYPETPVWDSSSNLSILFDLIGGSGGGYRTYKVGLLAISILLLVAVAGGAWAVGLGVAEVAVATAFAWFVFWTGFPNSLWRAGLFAFTLATCGVGLLLGLCSRFDRLPSRAGWLAMTIVGTSLFFVHVTTPILAIGGLVAFLLAVARRHGWRWHLAILGAAVLAVLVNLFWLVPLWRFREIRTESGLFMMADTRWFLYEYLSGNAVECRSALVLLVLGVAGLAGWWRRGLRGASAAFAGSIVVLILLTGFGSFWEPTKNLEPLRFRVAFQFLLAVPAASAVVQISGALARWVGGGRRGAVAAVLAWLAILGGWGGVERMFFYGSWLLITDHRPLVVGIKPEMSMMVDWMSKNTDLSGRILFEDQLRLLENTDPESVHWTPLLPILLGKDSRMFIGGLYQTAFIRHHEMAAFGDFRLGDRPIDEWSAAEVERYCDTYNIGWVVCWSPLSRFWFDRFPMASRLTTLPRYSSPYLPPSDNPHEWNAMIQRTGIDTARRYMLEGEGRYAIYRINRPRTYFLKGKGRIVAVEPNRIELADVEPEAGAVVVSLHWLDTWQTDPPLTVRPEPNKPDPVDFVRIEMPKALKRIVLSNGRARP